MEILWTLKQTESHYLKEIDIRKNNPIDNKIENPENKNN